ncbi:MAG: O-antigen ligase domain-containing protein [Desulfobacteraceae bacterium]|nr:MAG: O-antigen ligase domain-containing protein [Desulfobacteraceae bacterium]
METAAYLILLFVLIWSPLAFGAVHLQAQAVMSLGVFGATALLAIRSISRDRKTGARQVQLPATSLNLIFLLFLLYLIFQLIPLPEFVLRFLSPGALVAAQKSSPACLALTDKSLTGWHSISAYAGPVRQSFILWFTYGLFFFSFARVLNTRKRIDATVLAILVLGCFETIYGMGQAFTNQGYVWWMKKEAYSYVSGTYVNQNHFAGLMSMIMMAGVLYAAALWEKSKRNIDSFYRKRHLRARLSAWISGEQRINKINFVLFAAVVSGLGLIFSGSRGGMISAAAGLLLTGVLLLIRQSQRRKGIVVLVFFSIIFVYASAIGVEKPLSRFDKFYADWEARERYARQTLRLSHDSLFVGTGVGLFQYAFPKYQAAEDTTLFIEFAHNDWVQFLAEAGIVGIVLLFAGMSPYFITAFRTWRKRHEGFAVCMGILPFAALGAIALHSWSDFNLHIPANFLMLAAMLAIGHAAVHLPNPRNMQAATVQDRFIPLKYRGGAFLLILAAVIAWSGVWSFRYGAAEANYYAFTAQETKILPEEAFPLLESAVAWDPTCAEYRYNLSVALQKLRTSSRIDPDSGKQELKALQLRIIDSLQTAVSLNPLSAEPHVRLGWEYVNLWGEPDSRQKWVPAADLSMERGAFFAGENSPFLHFWMGDYWLWRSKTVRPASPEWDSMLVKARWHFQKNLALEKGDSRKRMVEQIKKNVWMRYPDQAFIRRMVEE